MMLTVAKKKKRFQKVYVSVNKKNAIMHVLEADLSRVTKPML